VVAVGGGGGGGGGALNGGASVCKQASKHRTFKLRLSGFFCCGGVDGMSNGPSSTS